MGSGPRVKSRQRARVGQQAGKERQASMTRRNVTTEQLREIVKARITKGDAFILKGDAYRQEQERVRQELAAMKPSEIVAKYPNHVYDIGRIL